MKTFVPLSDEEFKSKMDWFFYQESYLEDILEALRDCEVHFDFENFEYKEYWDHKSPIDDIIGFSTIDNFQYWGCSAGGDWEFPVYFILYWDGDKICGYVPMSSGNRFNRKTNKAYGNAKTYTTDPDKGLMMLVDTEDVLDLKEQFSEIFNSCDSVNIEVPDDVPTWTDEDVVKITDELHEVFNKGEDNDLPFSREGFIIWHEDIRAQEKQYVSVPYGVVVEDKSQIEKSFIFDTKDECNRWIANRTASVKQMFDVVLEYHVKQIVLTIEEKKS